MDVAVLESITVFHFCVHRCHLFTLRVRKQLQKLWTALLHVFPIVYVKRHC